MRMRKKPWARPALEACNYFVIDPMNYIGRWHEFFEKPQEIWLELGCGKGSFISKLAVSHLDKNFIAIDIKDEVLVLAKEKIDSEYAAARANTSNIKLMSQEIMIIHKMLSDRDLVGRIYINFCNPWYKGSDRSRRLTHPNQLTQYRTFLAPMGQIWFKTDDVDLFNDSIKYFERNGFEIKYLTEDLLSSGFDENIPTEHEKMYSELGHKIKFLIAEKVG